LLFAGPAARSEAEIFVVRLARARDDSWREAREPQKTSRLPAFLFNPLDPDAHC
jgi:hypothetical protein